MWIGRVPDVYAMPAPRGLDWTVIGGCWPDRIRTEELDRTLDRLLEASPPEDALAPIIRRAWERRLEDWRPWWQAMVNLGRRSKEQLEARQQAFDQWFDQWFADAKPRLLEDVLNRGEVTMLDREIRAKMDVLGAATQELDRSLRVTGRDFERMRALIADISRLVEERNELAASLEARELSVTS